MFEDNDEKSSISRGSCFISLPTAERAKFKKTPFTTTSTDGKNPVFHVRRFHVQRGLPVGDSIENFKEKNDEASPKDNGAQVKMSRTVVFDKKKSGGLFAKIKKKNEIEYSKFLEQQSKHGKRQQLKSDIEKIQLRLEKLVKSDKMKELGNSQYETLKQEITDLDVNEKMTDVVSVKALKKTWKSKKLLHGFGVASVIIASLFILLYILEGPKISAFIFSSGVLKWKSTIPPLKSS